MLYQKFIRVVGIEVEIISVNCSRHSTFLESCKKHTLTFTYSGSAETFQYFGIGAIHSAITSIISSTGAKLGVVTYKINANSRAKSPIE